ncbi:MAG: hypothetical protein K9N07_09155 [Candidatus Cloacimonetes bacterium]|nr:hypothetical protein [Candidatus Cloacimonadota bacterium]
MKKIMVISYYWPPCGGVGVQRWLKFVKYLSQKDWQITVLTTKNGDYPTLDESLLKKIPDKVKVIRTKTPTFSGLYKKLVHSQDVHVPHGSLEISSDQSLIKKVFIWIRLNLIVPDARKIWNRHAYSRAKQELSTNDYDMMITTGPPHSTHLIGLRMKKKIKLNWLADFRDPWTEMGYLKNVKRIKLTSILDKRLENKVVNNCDLIVAASKKIITDLNCIPDKIKLITNGFDPDEYAGIINKKLDDNFNLNYFGSLPEESNPISALQAVLKLYEQGIADIKINLWGNISQKVISILSNLDDKNIITFHDHIAHQKAVEYMVNSDLLLLMINRVENNEGIITAKLFEYLGSEVPILGIGPISSEPAKILEETKMGKMFDYDNVTDISGYIEQSYTSWKKGKLKKSGNIAKYNCVNQTEELIKFLKL